MPVSALRFARYTAPSGKEFACFASTGEMEDSFLFSPDGHEFHQLLALTQLNTAKIEEGQLKLALTFFNPINGSFMMLLFAPDYIKHGGEIYFKQNELQNNLKLATVPARPEVEYRCKTRGGTIIYVTSNRYGPDEYMDSFRFYVGDSMNMREVPIQHIERESDGKTIIATVERDFFWPPDSPAIELRYDDQPPKWGNEELIPLNRKACFVVETPEGMTITERC